MVVNHALSSKGINTFERDFMVLECKNRLLPAFRANISLVIENQKEQKPSDFLTCNQLTANQEGHAFPRKQELPLCRQTKPSKNHEFNKVCS